MRLPYLRHLSALTLLTLFFGFLAAQPYQRIHAYDTGNGPITGTYFDVTHFGAGAANPGVSMAIGHSLAGAQNGVITEILTNGDANASYEFTYPGGSPVVAEAICTAPNDDIIACFYDPTNQATDVIRFSLAAGVIWGRRLPSFHAQDLVCESLDDSEGVWLTGESTVNNRLVIEGLTGTGAPVFATEYALNNPNWGYQSTTGFQIKLNGALNRLVVVGNAVIAGGGQSEMLMLRTSLGGIVNWAKGYGDPNGGDYYHGKCLTQQNAFGNRFVVGFEYSNTGNPLNEAGAMAIDPLGNPTWINAYVGGGFFTGTDYIAEDVARRNNRFLLAGYFTPSGSASTSAYSLAIRPNGVPVQFNEYETTGLYPTASATLHGMTYNTVTNHHVMVGRYTTSSASPAVGWPWTGVPDAFWAVAANGLGAANCSTPGGVQFYGLNPVVANLGANLANMPQPVNSPIIAAVADPKHDTQCGALKTGSGSMQEAIEEQGNDRISIAYQELASKILIATSLDMEGEFTCQLLNLQGQVIAEQSGNASSYSFATSQLSKGIYLVRYTLPNGVRGVERIMIW